MIGKNVIPRAALRGDETAEEQMDYINLLVDEHHAIVTAISEGDEEKAREAMRRHLRGSQLRYRNLLRAQREDVR
jgi:DNA-binding FadR family transcriptional regulator